jgi:hypothetical protein
VRRNELTKLQPHYDVILIYCVNIANTHDVCDNIVMLASTIALYIAGISIFHCFNSQVTFKRLGQSNSRSWPNLIMSKWQPPQPHWTIVKALSVSVFHHHSLGTHINSMVTSHSSDSIYRFLLLLNFCMFIHCYNMKRSSMSYIISIILFNTFHPLFHSFIFLGFTMLVLMCCCTVLYCYTKLMYDA